MNGWTTTRELTVSETAMVSGGEFSCDGLRASVVEGAAVGASIGVAVFGFAYLTPAAIVGGFEGGLVGGTYYLFGQLIDYCF